MQKSECSVGQVVNFGRPNGATATGEITKLNRVRCKVKLTASFNSHEAGTVFTVPYQLLTPANGGVQATEFEADIPYNLFDHTENLIMQAINCVYGDLSPENLSCDGEATASQIRAKRLVLDRQLKGLEKAMGRPVSETQAWKWYEEFQKRQRMIS